MERVYKSTDVYECNICPICGSNAIILSLQGKFIVYKCSFEDCEYKFKNHSN